MASKTFDQNLPIYNLEAPVHRLNNYGIQNIFEGTGTILYADKVTWCYVLA